ncbi:hypothetical protein V8C35DRAFT_317950 [Trichoderma chlorosporum]
MSKACEFPTLPQPPVIRRQGFQFCDGVFSVNNVKRVGGLRLHELFNPSTLRLKRDQKAATEEAHQLFKKPFFAAQLKYYGVSFSPSSTREALQLLLKDAVHQGKCHRVPKTVMDLEKSMRTDYEPLQQKFKSDWASWIAEKKRKEDEAFKKCKTPGERAACNLDRFMDLYFLTDGKPDKTKTTEALRLSGFGDRSALHSMAEKIPGLHTCSGGQSPNRELCIGWDYAEVSVLAMGISDRDREARKVQKMAEKEQQLERHREYLAQIRSKKTSKGPSKRPQEFSLDRCKGSYIIQCDGITDNWDDFDTLTMDISSSKGNMLRAAYDFGILEGTMILSQSEETLQAIVGEDHGSSNASSSDEDEEDENEEGYDEYDENEDDDGNDLQSSISGKKRKLAKTSLAKASKSAAARSSDAKRRKTKHLPSLSRRVYFRLRGRETGEGMIHSDPESGHIDFLSDGCATFAGLIYGLPYVGRNVEFQGHKVSDLPKVKPEEWEAFSYEAYESARVGRWG